MNNNQKIEELEKQIENECIDLTETLRLHRIRCNTILSKIDNLKKSKHDLLRKEDCEKYYSVILSGGVIYDRFETLQSVEYYARGMRIYTALANFADHNDQNEKHRNWDGENLHYYIKLVTNTKFYYVENSDHWRNPTTIYFSTKEMTETALQMLKDEKLI